MKSNWGKIVILCLIATAANFGLSRISGLLGLGLYLDTVFTVTAAFAGSLGAGLITAALSTIAYGLTYTYWGFWLFGLCSAAAALLTHGVHRFFLSRYVSSPKGEEPPPLDRIIMLVVLSLVMCVLMSLMGALISVFIQLVLRRPIHDVSAETWLKVGLLKQGLHLAAAELLARIPVNIVDRFISVFGGYGAALLLRRLLWGTCSLRPVYRQPTSF
jgi:hypothetical protein